MGITTNQITDTLTPSTGTLNIVGTIQQNGTNIALPSQSGNSGKYLTTNGTAASWTNFGASSTGTLTITNNHLYVTPTYALPATLTGTAYRISIVMRVNTVNASGLMELFIRCGSAGTIADTAIWSANSSSPQMQSLVGVYYFDGIVQFNSATTTLAYLKNDIYQDSTYPTGIVQSWNAGVTTGSLTPTFLGVSIDSTSGGDYSVNHASVTRIA